MFKESAALLVTVRTAWANEAPVQRIKLRTPVGKSVAAPAKVSVPCKRSAEPRFSIRWPSQSYVPSGNPNKCMVSVTRTHFSGLARYANTHMDGATWTPSQIKPK